MTEHVAPIPIQVASTTSSKRVVGGRRGPPLEVRRRVPTGTPLGVNSSLVTLPLRHVDHLY